MFPRALLICAVVVVGCSHAETGAQPSTTPSSAASTTPPPVSTLPDLGDFAKHVIAAPTSKPVSDPNIHIYKVDIPFDQANNQLFAALYKNGWERKTPYVKLKAQIAPYENPTKGRYALTDVPFDNPGTCSLMYNPTTK